MHGDSLILIVSNKERDTKRENRERERQFVNFEYLAHRDKRKEEPICILSKLFRKSDHILRLAFKVGVTELNKIPTPKPT